MPKKILLATINIPPPQVEVVYYNKNNFMKEDKKEKAIIGLKKASTLLQRVIKMAEDKEYCIDVMQQNMAVIGLLKSAHHNLMENHLHTCFLNATNSKNEKLKHQMVDEIIKVSKLTNK